MAAMRHFDVIKKACNRQAVGKMILKDFPIIS